VLDALDDKYEPGWLERFFHRRGVIIVSLALAVIAVAGTAAIGVRRRAR
jgi:hypothetical protein